MMNNNYSNTDSILNKFASREWSKVIMFLRNRFNIPTHDCEDIFQDAFIRLLDNAKDGKLNSLSCSLSTYFISICKNKAMEHLRSQKHLAHIVSDNQATISDSEIKMDNIDHLLDLDDEDEQKNCRKNNLVKGIVKELPSPCNELLWGFYRDSLSLRTLADMFGYSNENSAKVTKHRCTEKFKQRYLDLQYKIF